MYKPVTTAQKADYWLKRLNPWRKVRYVYLELKRAVQHN